MVHPIPAALPTSQVTSYFLTRRLLISIDSLFLTIMTKSLNLSCLFWLPRGCKLLIWISIILAASTSSVSQSEDIVMKLGAIVTETSYSSFIFSIISHSCSNLVFSLPIESLVSHFNCGSIGVIKVCVRLNSLFHSIQSSRPLVYQTNLLRPVKKPIEYNPFNPWLTYNRGKIMFPGAFCVSHAICSLYWLKVCKP